MFPFAIPPVVAMNTPTNLRFDPPVDLVYFYMGQVENLKVTVVLEDTTLISVSFPRNLDGKQQGVYRLPVLLEELFILFVG